MRGSQDRAARRQPWPAHCWSQRRWPEALGRSPRMRTVVEVFTYWTAGGEAEGSPRPRRSSRSSIRTSRSSNATIAGGAGVNANVVLASRMGGGDPPDTFQIHGGAELIEKWVKANDFTQPLDRPLRGRGPGRQVPRRHRRARRATRASRTPSRSASIATACSGTTRRSSTSNGVDGADDVGRVLHRRGHAQGGRRHPARPR